ncbi:MAG: hypothetical protein JST92_07615, partial [Deltaproteobacteria bacterium]|nr:hypothetical protein [Deltaproteobacteria bacterium]
EVFTHEDESVRDRCALAVMELHEVVREGKRYDRAALADYLCARWKMRILFSDGKVWVLGRA